MNELLKSLFFKERQERIADSRSICKKSDFEQKSKWANEQKSEEQNRKFPILER